MVPLTLGMFSMIDAEEYLQARELNWVAHFLPRMGKYRAVSRTGGKFIYLHRFILKMNDEDRRLVDHENTDTLDNRVRNLRFANKAKNGQNRGKPVNNKSGYKWVSWNSRVRKWHVQLQANNVRYDLGFYDDPKEGYAVACEAALRLHGEFANLG